MHNPFTPVQIYNFMLDIEKGVERQVQITKLFQFFFPFSLGVFLFVLINLFILVLVRISVSL